MRCCIQGRNDFAIYVMTRELGILTWDEAFLSLRSTLLPDALRAKYCELIIGQYRGHVISHLALTRTSVRIALQNLSFLRNYVSF